MQMDAIQNSSARMAQSSLEHLERISSLAVQLFHQEEIQTDEDVINVLKEYAESAKLVGNIRIVFCKVMWYSTLQGVDKIEFRKS